MKDNATDIAAAARRLLGYQLLGGAIGVAIFLYTKGSWGAVSASYGALVSIVTTLLLSWGVKRAERVAVESLGKSQAILYLGAVQRFVSVLVMFLVGFAVLKLDPLATVIGFGLAHAANLFGLRGSR